jgi:hypothetical protein
MAKPEKKVKPKDRQAAAKQLAAMQRDLLKWRAAGLPKRPAITAAEVDRRLALFAECLSLLRQPACDCK